MSLKKLMSPAVLPLADTWKLKGNCKEAVLLFSFLSLKKK
jgi:hypothetical protein